MIYLSSDLPAPSTTVEKSKKTKLAPGDDISADSAFMRGHGTYTEDEVLRASVAGNLHRVNKLISVQAPKTRYNGDIGDVVVGRIVDVGQKRWKVDLNARLDAVLLLSSLNLPGGELRRKGTEDEMLMRDYLQEGDLISAEVQNVFQDGSLSLHTRSLKYGRLSQGVLVKIPPSLVRRRKSHFHSLACGASCIFGCNGYVWIFPLTSSDETGGFVQNLDMVPSQDREIITRLKNCVELLATNLVMLDDTSLLVCYECSMPYDTSEILRHEIGSIVLEQTNARLLLEQEGFG